MEIPQNTCIRRHCGFLACSSSLLAHSRRNTHSPADDAMHMASLACLQKRFRQAPHARALLLATLAHATDTSACPSQHSCTPNTSTAIFTRPISNFDCRPHSAANQCWPSAYAVAIANGQGGNVMKRACSCTKFAQARYAAADA